MNYRVIEEDNLLFIMDNEYNIDFIIDELTETLYITKNENRPRIPEQTN